MKRLFLILILTFSFQSWIKADDIRDFQIEGMSIGDSLLDYYSKKELKESLSNVTFYPKSKKFKVILFSAKDTNLYDTIQFHIKNGNENYVIYAIKGVTNISINKCLKRKKDVINEINTILSNTSRKDAESDYAKSYGDSKAYINNFFFESGESFRIWCTKWDKNNKLVKDRKWKDGLSISLYSEEINNFLENEAY
jgi:hypothetical protein